MCHQNFIFNFSMLLLLLPKMNKDDIGYLKYSGDLVKDGIFDAKKSAQALIGLDEALRFFIVKQDPELEEIDFEIPVKIQSGSWEAIVTGACISGGIIATAYFTTAAQKMAENDFKNMGLKTIFKKSFKAIQWVIKIGKHLGSMSQKQIERIKFDKQDSKIIGIPNIKGEYLDVPKEYLDWFIDCPSKLLSNMANLIEVERKLGIGVNEEEGVSEVIISESEKYVFASKDELEEILLPELIHGQYIELEGEITKGNEKTNSIGLEYKGLILTCRPMEGKSVIIYKDALFRKCKVKGIVDRRGKYDLPFMKKPQIIFNKIIPINIESEPTLFE